MTAVVTLCQNGYDDRIAC